MLKMMLGLLVATAAATPSAVAGESSISGCRGACQGTPGFEASGHEVVEDPGTPGSHSPTGALPRFYYRVDFTQACPNNLPGGADSECAHSTSACPTPQIMYNRWHSLVDRDSPADLGPWTLVDEECHTGAPATPARASTVEIYDAFTRLPVPRATLHVQPGGRTLVHLDTIFYTEVDTQNFPDVDLVVEKIDFRAEPERYIWHFGDGADDTTTSPGAPYPEQTVTHAYASSGSVEAPSVTVVWKGQYKRKDETVWRDVPARVNADGPAVDLRVVSARSQLVENPD